MKYRPHGWDNPCAEERDRSIFEAGADAMLQLLIREAYEYGETEHHHVRHDDYLCDVLAEGIQL